MTVDIVVIGAGIVGLSTAMQLKAALPDANLLVLEKEAAPAQHQTGHNSGVIHAGIYYVPGSLKAQFCRAGNAATKAFCDQHAIPWQGCGKLLVATSKLEVTRMENLRERGLRNDLQPEWLDADELQQREPAINGMAGMFIPDSGIVDYRQVAAAMAQQITDNGGEIRYHSPVSAMHEDAQAVTLTTPQGEVQARFVVSCAGLMADRLVRMLGIQPGFIICPFRGEYFRLPPARNSLIKHLIYPIPDPSVPFLGVHLTRTIDGGITVGPNAVLAFKREGYQKSDFSWSDTRQLLAHSGVRRVLRSNLRNGLQEWKNSCCQRGYLRLVQKYCPQLQLSDLQPWPAGVRAQAVSDDGKLVDDFLFVTSRRSFHVCNAPSPAATSALPIGSHIVQQLQQQLAQLSGPGQALHPGNNPLDSKGI